LTNLSNEENGGIHFPSKGKSKMDQLIKNHKFTLVDVSIFMKADQLIKTLFKKLPKEVLELIQGSDEESKEN